MLEAAITIADGCIGAFTQMVAFPIGAEEKLIGSDWPRSRSRPVV